MLSKFIDQFRFEVELTEIANSTGDNFSFIMDDFFEIMAGMVNKPENPIIIMNLETKILLEEIDDKEIQDFLKENVEYHITYDVEEITETFCKSCNHRYEGAIISCFNCHSNNIVVQYGWKCQRCGEKYDTEQQAEECNEKHIFE